RAAIHEGRRRRPARSGKVRRGGKNLQCLVRPGKADVYDQGGSIGIGYSPNRCLTHGTTTPAVISSSFTVSERPMVWPSGLTQACFGLPLRRSKRKSSNGTCVSFAPVIISMGGAGLPTRSMSDNEG